MTLAEIDFDAKIAKAKNLRQKAKWEARKEKVALAATGEGAADDDEATGEGGLAAATK